MIELNFKLHRDDLGHAISISTRVTLAKVEEAY